MRQEDVPINPVGDTVGHTIDDGTQPITISRPFVVGNRYGDFRQAIGNPKPITPRVIIGMRGE